MSRENYIPAAQTFNCTHGRRGVFLLRLERNPKTDRWSWHMVFAGHPDACPEHLQNVISSSEDYVSGNICKILAEQQAYALSAMHEEWYHRNRSVRSIPVAS